MSSSSETPIRLIALVVLGLLAVCGVSGTCLMFVTFFLG